MKKIVEGFSLEVQVRDGLPHVRVDLANGETVVNTEAVSIDGLERLSVVFDSAARLAALEMEKWHSANRTAQVAAQELAEQR